MSWDPDEEDDQIYRVIVDRERQISIVLASQRIPSGWQDAGYTGKKRACLDQIQKSYKALRLVDWSK